MSQAVQNPPPGFEELSVDDTLDYVQSLWDRIAANPPTTPSNSRPLSRTYGARCSGGFPSQYALCRRSGASP